MLNKKFWAALGTAAILASAAIPALAATEGAVSATVTPQLISVSVSPTSVDYGTLAVSTESAPQGPITATNDGNVTENLNIKGSNSTSWTLSDTAAGANTFMHKFAKSQDGYTAYTALHNTNYTALATGVAGSGGTQLFNLKLTMPTSTAVFTQQSTTVTVQAVAAGP